MAPDLVPEDVEAQREAEACEDASSEEVSEADVGAVCDARRDGLKGALRDFMASEGLEAPEDVEDKLDEVVDGHLLGEKPLRSVFAEMLAWHNSEMEKTGRGKGRVPGGVDEQEVGVLRRQVRSGNREAEALEAGVGVADAERRFGMSGGFVFGDGEVAVDHRWPGGAMYPIRR